MAKTKEQKKAIVKTLEQELKEAENLIFVDYYGLKVKEIDNLKKMLRAKGYRYLVTKKTLLKLAFDKLGFKNIDLDKFKGGLGLVYGLGEETELSKILEQFIRTGKNLTIQGGVFDSEFFSADAVVALAKLPSRQELIAKAIGAVKAPLNNLSYVLAGNLRSLVYVLGSIKKVSLFN